MSDRLADQMPSITVTVRYGEDDPETIRVRARNRDDAVLRAGMALEGGDPDQWVVTSVRDPASTLDARAERLDTIGRAIDLIDNADPAALERILDRTNFHDHLKRDHAALRRNLATAEETGRIFSMWKASQQFLKAAGLPY